MKDWNTYKRKIERWIDKHEVLYILTALLLILTVFFTGYAVGKAKRIKKANAEEITSTYIYTVNLTLPTVWNYTYNTTTEQWYANENIKLIIGINDNDTSYINIATNNTVLNISGTSQYLIVTYEYNDINKQQALLTRATMTDYIDKIKKVYKIETWINPLVINNPETNIYTIKINVLTNENENQLITITCRSATNQIYPIGSTKTPINDITILNSQTDIDLNTYWQNAYNEGVKEGKVQGIEEGKTTGYANGLQDGLKQAQQGTFQNLMDAVFYAPVKALFGLLNFEVLGFNMWSIFIGLIGTLTALCILKLLTKFIF